MSENKAPNQNSTAEHFLLTKFVAAALLCGIVYIVWPKSQVSTPTDALLSGLSRENSKLAPEQLDNSTWLFWCTGDDPGMMSGGTEFLAADEFSRKHALEYLGPSQKTSETYSYNLIFVRADGSYSEKKVTKFAFEKGSNDQVCWYRTASIIVFVAKGLLRVEKKNG